MATVNPAVFDPYEYPDADFCMNCYSGSAQNKTEMEGIWETVVTFCSGKLLANNDYKASDCTFFGGNCCDDDISTDPNMGKKPLNNLNIFGAMTVTNVID
jgi:hypothetical protein